MIIIMVMIKDRNICVEGKKSGGRRPRIKKNKYLNVICRKNIKFYIFFKQMPKE